MPGNGEDFARDFARITGRTLDDVLAEIDREAALCIAAMDLNLTWKRRNEMARWLVRQLGRMRVYQRPPSPQLVELAAHLLGVAAPPRARRRNPVKFREAARYVAEHPNATPSMIARAIGYDQKAQIKVWLEDPEFQRIVNSQRQG